MKQNSAEPLASVQSEVRRYLVLPGQATSYKVGMIKIQQLRARAEEPPVIEPLEKGNRE